jgi:hypothetical protein
MFGIPRPNSWLRNFPKPTSPKLALAIEIENAKVEGEVWNGERGGDGGAGAPNVARNT